MAGRSPPYHQIWTYNPRFYSFRRDLAMGEVLLKALCEMYGRASRERDSAGGQLRLTVQRAAGRAVLTWVERMGRNAMRYEFGLWKAVISTREMEELRCAESRCLSPSLLLLTPPSRVSSFSPCDPLVATLVVLCRAVLCCDVSSLTPAERKRNTRNAVSRRRTKSVPSSRSRL
jgi:hypothetical protein